MNRNRRIMLQLFISLAIAGTTACSENNETASLTCSPGCSGQTLISCPNGENGAPSHQNCPNGCENNACKSSQEQGQKCSPGCSGQTLISCPNGENGAPSSQNCPNGCENNACKSSQEQGQKCSPGCSGQTLISCPNGANGAPSSQICPNGCENNACKSGQEQGGKCSPGCNGSNKISCPDGEDGAPQITVCKNGCLDSACIASEITEESCGKDYKAVCSGGTLIFCSDSSKVEKLDCTANLGDCASIDNEPDCFYPSEECDAAGSKTYVCTDKMRYPKICTAASNGKNYYISHVFQAVSCDAGCNEEGTDCAACNPKTTSDTCQSATAVTCQLADPETGSYYLQLDDCAENGDSCVVLKGVKSGGTDYASCRKNLTSCSVIGETASSCYTGYVYQKKCAAGSDGKNYYYFSDDYKKCPTEECNSEGTDCK